VRVAALYDVHGNLPALEAVLAELERERPDLILFGGDIVSGPFPVETLDLVRSLGDRARCIRGNADRGVVEIYDGAEPTGGLNDDWVAHQLTSEQRDFLAALPEQEVVDVDALGPVLFVHATVRSDEEIATTISSDDRFRECFGAAEQHVVVCGHTHIQFDRTAGGTRIVNAGSVGMPYGDTGAHWLLLGPDVEHRRTAYDLDAAAERVRASGWGPAERFARENVLTVPSAQEAAEFFESRIGG
jgi:diadenosine tetraphosphatase ApaH/serine/threonine PP2A family protein phosphatase